MALHVAARCHQLGFDVPLGEVIRPWLYGLPNAADCVECLYSELTAGSRTPLDVLANRNPPASFQRMCKQTRDRKLLH
jgi:hypothetical protein